MTDNSFIFRCDYAKTNRSGCKKCKEKIDKGVVRIAKLKTNPFSDDGGLMTDWHHPKCVFETFAKARATTKKIECSADIEHFDSLKPEDQEVIENLIKEYIGNRKTGAKQPASKNVTPAPVNPAKLPSNGSVSSKQEASPTSTPTKTSTFSDITRLCDKIRSEASYNSKSEIVRRFFKDSSDDIYLKLKLMIPSVDKRVFNVKDKQLVKILSSVIGASLDEMSDDLEQGDIGKTGHDFYEKSHLTKPSHSSVTLEKIDMFLDKLTTLTREEEQIQLFKKMIKHLTPHDLQYVLYLIKKDMRMNAREKHVLEGFHPKAYQAFQMSHDLADVAQRFAPGASDKSTSNDKIGLQLMTPVRPMLAEACKSIAQALAKCPEGMYSEIKYDGERVQLHKKGDQFQFFSRSLKPVLPHKVQDVSKFVPEAFPTGDSIILDCEVLLVDFQTGKPLPFGTLGIHKKSEFKTACVCLFVFDILYLNGDSLVDKPVRKRREILSSSIKEIPNRVVLSEMKLVKTASELGGMISHVLKEGLEGLVLKGLNTTYEPGKRHWLKVKKDYLQGGAMADSADLVVLGGYLGTGNKGGMCSVYLMGCYCPATNLWKTVCKVGNGHDDATLEKISKEMMTNGKKIKGDYNSKPAWLSISKGLMPDYIVTDPKQSAVWEISGAEFSQSSVHTAGGISIRFPRVTKIRDDKDWKTATDLPRLQKLMRTSQEKADAAIEKLMLKEGGGKITMPKSVAKTSVSSETATGEESNKRKQTTIPSVSKRAKTSNNECPLKDVFHGAKFHVSSRIPEQEVLKRYCVAFGGEITMDKKLADVHVLGKRIPHEKCVTKEWIVEEIKRKS